MSDGRADQAGDGQPVSDGVNSHLTDNRSYDTTPQQGESDR